VVIELPSEVPVGRTELTVQVGRPEPTQVYTVNLDLSSWPKAFPLRPTDPDLAREFDAFQRLLPELLKTHRGEFAAVHNGEVVGFGQDRVSLATDLYRRHGYRRTYIELVTDEPQPVARLPFFREIDPGPGASTEG
jgi:hypothetical protein